MHRCSRLDGNLFEYQQLTFHANKVSCSQLLIKDCERGCPTFDVDRSPKHESREIGKLVEVARLLVFLLYTADSLTRPRR